MQAGTLPHAARLNYRLLPTPALVPALLVGVLAGVRAVAHTPARCTLCQVHGVRL